MPLRPDADLKRAVAAVRESERCPTDVRSRAGGTGTLAERVIAFRDAYLDAVQRASRALANHYTGLDWLEAFHTTRYWHIQELRHDSGAPLLLIQSEIDYQSKRLGELADQLQATAAQEALADRAAHRVLLDTNVHLHCQPFDQVPWGEAVKVSKVHLLVPLLVVEELGNVKNRGGEMGGRAGVRLRTLQSALGNSARGPAKARPNVTIEVLLDEPGHVRRTNNDEEILDLAEGQHHRHPGRALLATGDPSMLLRARARDIPVAEVPAGYRLPASRQ